MDGANNPTLHEKKARPNKAAFVFSKESKHEDAPTKCITFPT